MKCCPSCNANMSQHLFEPMLRTGAAVPSKIEVDVCWPCHLIWFDGFESARLSPRAVVEFFKLIHSQDQAALTASVLSTPITMKLDCPVCGSGLRDSHDLTKNGRIKYFRCPLEHGRLITFVQFLREKGFIRDLTDIEIDTLAVTVKQVRCSSCGGPIDLRKDHACTHCGAAISVLDKNAATKTLNGLIEAHEARLLSGLSDSNIGGSAATIGKRDFHQMADTNARAATVMAAAKYQSDELKERRRREREGFSHSGALPLIGIGDVARAGDLLTDSIGEFFSNIDF